MDQEPSVGSNQSRQPSEEQVSATPMANGDPQGIVGDTSMLDAQNESGNPTSDGQAEDGDQEMKDVEDNTTTQLERELLAADEPRAKEEAQDEDGDTKQEVSLYKVHALRTEVDVYIG